MPSDCAPPSLPHLWTVVSGLKWQSGATPPSNGYELDSENLVAALKGKSGTVTFDQAEWDGFFITTLLKTHYVKSGNTYFTPVAADASNDEEAKASCPGPDSVVDVLQRKIASVRDDLDLLKEKKEAAEKTENAGEQADAVDTNGIEQVNLSE